MTNAPGAATVTLIDPKRGVDYGHLEALPHLDGGIVVEQAEAIEAGPRPRRQMEEALPAPARGRRREPRHLARR